MSESSNSSQERSLNSQVVLEEDEYTAALSHIIARDFFPSLVHLGATNDYLDALDTRDPHLINASVRRIEEISATPASSRRGGRLPYQTPSQTPYAAGPSQTPMRTPIGSGSEERPTKRPRYDTNLGLDNFQARYTSEDNSSFTQILDQENKQRKEKWGWAWEAQKRVEQQKDRMLEARERMLIEAPTMTGVREKFVIEAPTNAGLITDGKEEKKDEGESHEEEKDAEGKEGKQMILKEADKSNEIDVMAPKKDTRSAGVDGWKFKTRNSLMFPPDADSSPYHQRPKLVVVPKGEEKSIAYNGTRLPEQDDSTATSRPMSEPPSPTRSRIDAAIQGTEYRPKSPSGSRFSLVPDLPSPTPSELGPAAVKELMTWGTLNATPRIISSDDPAEALPPPVTPFRISEPSSRELLSHKLSNKASKSLRAKAGLLGLGQTPGISRTPGTVKKGNMGPPSWTPRRSEAAGNLTPAAKRLLNRTMGTSGVRRAEAMERVAGWDGSKGKEKDLSRVRWTPTPNEVSRR
ncbi:hypothetical protein K435DRAFT_746086 [Dendrothele bispora CBS 962.96]|uniref:Nuclear protein DGCR14 n=1 Tax=Dendrothele bispora (strain CBS 962.96) TaxID=1314807 RepID=A0A4V4HI11_DENBC|nr:hypothetical protein K435DRAFT_840850 [Dendrothele bispora CBS 962.96]THV04826.1 hypothetical protein K435DRAFT_746086 [Dendrothele bispora CBS 962.96]